MPEFTYEEYVQYLESNDNDSSAVMGLVDGPTTERTLKKLNPEAYARYQQFAKRLLEENKAFIEIIMLIRKVKRMQMAKYYPALHDALFTKFLLWRRIWLW